MTAPDQAAKNNSGETPDERPSRLFLVSYRISTDQVRAGIEKFLQDKSEAWWHYLPHTWMIITKEEPKQMIEWFRFFFGASDRILMFEVPKDKNEYFGWLPADGWSWLREPESRAATPRAPLEKPA